MKKNIVIGTRGSALALWQARWVQSRLKANYPDVDVDLQIIKTKGDKILDVPLAQIGGKGLFVKEIETALLGKEIDLAVHSVKDMPSELPEGLCLGAVTKRENPLDVIISRKDLMLKDMGNNARIGTSSVRRSSQILNLFPDFTIVPIRGNVDTRLKKLESEKLDAIILAAAGVIRLGFEERITQFMDIESLIPAVGQGALGIEIRDDDVDMMSAMSHLNDPSTHVAIIAERAFLRQLEGGCQVPVAAHAVIDSHETIRLQGMIAALTGNPMIRHEMSGKATQAEAIGKALAKKLLEQGGEQILNQISSCAE